MKRTQRTIDRVKTRSHQGGGSKTWSASSRALSRFWTTPTPSTKESTPGWVYNLRASPKATVVHGTHSADVTARPATEIETEKAFEVGTVFYPGFPKYRERASHREIEVFVLESDQT
jgi:hypothetical protein